MSEWHGIDFAPQGWQCPICKRVYSPTTPMCYYCGNRTAVLRTNVVAELIDGWHHETITKAEKPEESR